VTKENPLRPHSTQLPKRILSHQELQRYELRRRPGFSKEAHLGCNLIGSASKRFVLLLWNAPAILLSKLARLMRAQ